MLALLLVGVAFTGCDRQQDELFSESSANRADAAVAASQQVLTSVQTWKMEYFPGTQMDYGGYNVYLSFGTDGKVTVLSEIADADESAVSLYTVAQSGGPMLSIDTYNEIFSYFSAPDAIGDKGTGMGGDNDFLILKASTDSVILKSAKHGHHYKMVPFTGNVTEEITALQQAEEDMSFPQYNMTVDGKEVTVSKSYRTLTFTYTDGEDEVSVTAPYIQTQTGFTFYEPVTVAGMTFSELTYNEATYTFSGGSNVVVEGYVPPLSTTIKSGYFYMSGSEMSTSLLQYFKAGATSCANYGYDVQLCGLGADFSSSAWGIYAICGGYYSIVPFTAEVMSDDELKLAYDTSAGTATTLLGNGSVFYSYGLYYAVYALTGSTDGSTSKTWKLTTDNLKTPTWIKLVNTEDETEYFTVTSASVYYPFE